MTARTEASPPITAAPSAVPLHVAVIMDGNGRWAKQRGLPRLAGHRAGTENIRRVIRAFADQGVKYLTIYAFSTENWSRPPDEVKGLWRLLGQVIRKERDALHENGVRLQHIGRRDRLSPPLLKAIDEAAELTRNNTRLVLSVALDYGGRDEILGAVRAIVRQGVRPEDISDETIASRLFTAGLPDPDLVIRTAGEMRLSNFLIWQTAYAEFYVTAAYWPDFDEEEIRRALEAYARRERRFGSLKVGKAADGVSASRHANRRGPA